MVADMNQIVPQQQPLVDRMTGASAADYLVKRMHLDIDQVLLVAEDSVADSVAVDWKWPMPWLRKNHHRRHRRHRPHHHQLTHLIIRRHCLPRINKPLQLRQHTNNTNFHPFWQPPLRDSIFSRQ